MKILHVIPYMHPRAGGPPVAVEHFIQESNRSGCVSEIITTSLFCDGDPSSLLKRLSDFATTTCLVHGRVGLLLSQRARWKMVERIQLADIVHVHTVWNP